MSPVELSQVKRTVDIDAPIDRVWRALTDPPELEAWFRVTVDGPIRAGATVWMTSKAPEHNCVRFDVEIVELTPPRRMVWRWHPGAPDPDFDYSQEPRTTVTFTLEPTASGTRLTVLETGFDRISLERRASVFADNDQGWTEVLGWFRDYVASHR